MKSISIAMAAYNEAQNIETMICEVVDIMSRISFNYEFVIVNDGSTDETANIVKSVAERYPQVRLLTHEVNRGYGAAVFNVALPLFYRTLF